MDPKWKWAGSFLVVMFVFGLYAGLLAAVQPGEMQKMNDAMPKQPIVKPKQARKLLVFSLCQGYQHASIPYWDEALAIMGQQTGAFDVTISRDLNVFQPESLNRFDAVCFNNTVGLKLSVNDTPVLCKSIMAFIQEGKGIVGIHGATDNFKQWPAMQEIMGGTFTGHPWTADGVWAIRVDDPNHPLMRMFKDKQFKLQEEIYRTDPPLYDRTKQRVLMSLDLSDPNTAGAKGVKPADTDTGISWIKNVGKGRLFYCSLGHNIHLSWNPEVLEHYLAGIQFAMGDLKCDTQPIPAATKPGAIPWWYV